MKYPLTYSSWDKKEIKAMNRVIETGYFSMGKTVERFENKFASYLNRKYAVMVNSGSSANLIGLMSFLFTKRNKIKEGDEIIVPAIAWSTTYSPLKYLGARLKIIDINLDDLNVDISKLKQSISKKTASSLKNSYNRHISDCGSNF